MRTRLNAGTTDNWKAESRPTEVNFKSFRRHGRFTGWLIMPPGATAEKKVPMVLVIHGGPHTAWHRPGPFSPLLQLLGRPRLYGAVPQTPRGSNGCGQKFQRRLRQTNWGGGDYKDPHGRGGPRPRPQSRNRCRPPWASWAAATAATWPTGIITQNTPLQGRRQLRPVSPT